MGALLALALTCMLASCAGTHDPATGADEPTPTAGPTSEAGDTPSASAFVEVGVWNLDAVGVHFEAPNGLCASPRGPNTGFCG